MNGQSNKVLNSKAQLESNAFILSEKNMEKSNYMVTFSGNSQNYCVGLVDMVNSTKISARLNQQKLSKFYEIFLNSMANIVERFGGFVIKNIGDSLLYYFPESSDSSKNYGFLNCLECCMEMIQAHKTINNRIQQEGLPPLNYRISADYGKVTIMNSNNSTSIDMLGIPVNICSKINYYAPQNGAVIGSDLYEMVKNFDDYQCSLIQTCSIGLKYDYPVFSVERKG